MKQPNTAMGAGASEIPLISIVDNDESVRKAIRCLIRSMGYKAEVFASAEDFLSSGQLNEMASLILDVRMAGMSGMELVVPTRISLLELPGTLTIEIQMH